VAGEPRDYVAAHPAAAALVVEVADSSLRLDRRLKAGLYARGRLQDYWIVNLIDGTVEVHRNPRLMPNGWAYASIEVVRPPAAVAPLMAPETAILVRDLLP
jgi:hypothetical protein